MGLGGRGARGANQHRCQAAGRPCSPSSHCQSAGPAGRGSHSFRIPRSPTPTADERVSQGKSVRVCEERVRRERKGENKRRGVGEKKRDKMRRGRRMGRWVTCSDSDRPDIWVPLRPRFGGSLPLIYAYVHAYTLRESPRKRASECERASKIDPERNRGMER